jgi:hypothetical protein
MRSMGCTVEQGVYHRCAGRMLENTPFSASLRAIGFAKRHPRVANCLHSAYNQDIEVGQPLAHAPRGPGLSCFPGPFAAPPRSLHDS